jgi:hypothetical protein
MSSENKKPVVAVMRNQKLRGMTQDCLAVAVFLNAFDMVDFIVQNEPDLRLENLDSEGLCLMERAQSQRMRNHLTELVLVGADEHVLVKSAAKKGRY